MHLRLFHTLRHGVVIALVLALLGGLLLPLSAEELAWHVQQQGWLTALPGAACDAAVRIAPPFFMEPLRRLSLLFDLHGTSPLLARLAGVAHAGLWLYLVLALIRRLARDRTERHMIAVIACTLIGLGCTPLLLVWNRPEQTIVLAITAALLIASTAWQAPGNRFAPFAAAAFDDMAYSNAPAAPATAWARSLGITALAMLALACHAKALITLPVFATAILMASKGPRAHLPRAVALALLMAAAVTTLGDWSAHLACATEQAHDRQIIDALFMARSGQSASLPGLAGAFLSNMRLTAYIDHAAPQVFPAADWLVAGRVSDDEVQGWRGGMRVIWALAGTAGLVAALSALWQQGRRRVLACDAAMALVLLAVAALWSAARLVRSDADVGFVLPLLVLAIIMALASPYGLGPLRRALPVLSMALGSLMLLSMVLICGLYGPPLVEALGAGPLPLQPASVPLLGSMPTGAPPMLPPAKNHP